MNKYYKIEIIYTQSLGMISSNTYIHYAKEKPKATTKHKPMQDIYNAYFENPIKAEEHKEKIINELIKL